MSMTIEEDGSETTSLMQEEQTEVMMNLVEEESDSSMTLVQEAEAEVGMSFMSEEEPEIQAFVEVETESAQEEEVSMSVMDFDYMNAFRIVFILAIQAVALYFGVVYAKQYYQAHFGNLKAGKGASTDEEQNDNRSENLLKYDAEEKGYKKL